MPFKFWPSKAAPKATAVPVNAAGLARRDEESEEMAREFEENARDVRSRIQEQEREAADAITEASAAAAAVAEALADADVLYVHPYTVTISWSRALGFVWAVVWTTFAIINSRDAEAIAVEHVCERASCSLAICIQWGLLIVLGLAVGVDFKFPIEDIDLPKPPTAPPQKPPTLKRNYVEWNGQAGPDGKIQRGKIYNVPEEPLLGETVHGVPEEEVLQEYIDFATDLKARGRFKGRIFEFKPATKTREEMKKECVDDAIKELDEIEKKFTAAMEAWRAEVERIKKKNAERREFWSAVNKKVHAVAWFTETLIAFGLMTVFPIYSGVNICVGTIPFCGFPGFLFGSTTFTLCTYVYVIRNVMKPVILQEILVSGAETRARAESEFQKGRRPNDPAT